MKTIPKFLRNAETIIAIVSQMQEKFKPRIGKDKHESIIPGLSSRFSTLHSIDMPEFLINTIFEDSDFDEFLKETYSFIQIQRYLPGDFIVPHKDLYNIQELHLITLTKSDTDGLVLEDGSGGLIKILDEPGQKIVLSDEYHWVDPVKELRYSLVVGE